MEEDVTVSFAPKKTPPSRNNKRKVSVAAPRTSKRSRLLSDNEHVVPKKLVSNPEVIDDVPRLSIGDMTFEDFVERFRRLNNGHVPAMSTPAARANSSSPANKEPKRAPKKPNDDGKTLPKSASNKIPVLVKIAKPKQSVAGRLRKSVGGERNQPFRYPIRSRMAKPPSESDQEPGPSKRKISKTPAQRPPTHHHDHRDPKERKDPIGKGRSLRLCPQKPAAGKKGTGSPSNPIHIEDSSVEEDVPVVLRRSSRVQSLAYWRNERVIYKTDEATGTRNFAGIMKGDNMPKEKASRKQNKANKDNRRVAKDDHNHHNSELIGEEHMHIRTPINVINPETQELVAVDCVAPLKSCVFYGSHKKVAMGNNNAITVTTAIDQLAFAQGIIRIRPYKETKTSIAEIDTLGFFIVAGTVQVTIHETTVVLTEKASFFVPRGNKYSMKNPTGQTVELSFFRLRGG